MTSGNSLQSCNLTSRKQAMFLPATVMLAAYMLVSPAFSATVTTIYNFGSKLREVRDPTANLTIYRGALYGSTDFGGGGGPKRDGSGGIFRLSLTSFFEKTILAFTGKTDSVAKVTALNGSLYGVTASGGTHGYGTIVKLDPMAKAATVVHNFEADVGYPNQILTAVGGLLYGTTIGRISYQGYLFSFDPVSNKFTTLHTQSQADGVYPNPGLVSDGTALYGSAEFGGTYNYGTIFKFDLTTGQETTVHSFPYGKGAVHGLPIGELTLHDGEIFGVASTYDRVNSIYRVNLKTGFVELMHGYAGYGGVPDSLQFKDGLLYGTTSREDGDNDCGSVFTIDVGTLAYTILHEFGGSSDGCAAFGLIRDRSIFYGATTQGGANGTGTVFKLVP